MANITNPALLKAASGIKKASFCFHIFFYLLGVVVPINNIINSSGHLPLHIASLAVSLVLLALYIIYFDTEDKKAFKQKRKKAKKAKRIVKKLSRLYVICATVYAISFTAKGVSVLLTVLLVLVLFLNILFEVLRIVIEKQTKKLVNLFKARKTNNQIDDKETIVVDNYIEK